MTASILLIDNYDSFTYNIYQYLAMLGAKVRVVKNDDYHTYQHLALEQYSHLVISPGPGDPKDSKLSFEALSYFENKKPILGICLGQQIIANYYGSSTVQTPLLAHGVSEMIYIKPTGLFYNLPVEFKVARYHSLVVHLQNNTLIPCAWTKKDNLLMALRHPRHNIFGFQFHPESIGTDYGLDLLRNFINIS